MSGKAGQPAASVISRQPIRYVLARSSESHGLPLVLLIVSFVLIVSFMLIVSFVLIVHSRGMELIHHKNRNHDTNKPSGMIRI